MTGDQRLSMPIRPGVTFPNWTAVTSQQAAQALSAIFAAFSIEKCWTDYSAQEDDVRQVVLRSYERRGRAPLIEEICAELGHDSQAVKEILKSLGARDLVVLAEDGETLKGAYPFSDSETEHKLTIGDQTAYAMCAIDALGAGAMFGRDTAIDSVCRHCGEPIHVDMQAQGTELQAYSPAGAGVWSGIRYEDGCAATSLCPVIAFFCCEAHADAWRQQHHPGVEGFQLTMDEARQAGLAIFSPMLAAAKAPAS